jgi:REP element-mobilizing transposase RayT
MRTHRQIIIGHHLIWTLYGHWLANDPRGSGSEALRDPKFAPIGDIHFGRKPEHLQPSRDELKGFYREARPLLEFAPFWIDEAKRQALADIVREVVQRRPYTAWACAILSNHVHLVMRRHSDDAVAIWTTIADAARMHLRDFSDVEPDHPVWAARPYKVFLRTPREVRTRVRYVEGNPQKEGLAPQRYDFVTTYDNWPFHHHR